jgi:hypothetical protein
MSHTPGPWIAKTRVFEMVVDAVGGGGICIVDCGPPDDVHNARLIAAAPDLLSELKKQCCTACKEMLGNPKPSEEECFCDDARIVIAKAEGGKS